MSFSLETLQANLTVALAAAETIQAVEHIRQQYLGKNGELTALLKSIGQLSPEERPAAGAAINRAKETMTEAIEMRLEHFKTIALQSSLSQSNIDISLSGRGEHLGSLHPITRTQARIEAFFSRYGFDVKEGDEIESEYYNFTALNIPEGHPARANHDTFYLNNGQLLRTHTSPVQIHVLQDPSLTLPLRMITPGRVYRRDSDVTHTPMFHQVEGLVVEAGANFAQLKSLLSAFMIFFFEREVDVRFRASYFPFTEPSAEMDISCFFCEAKKSKTCRICKGTGWLEVLGCGMVHPKVLAVNPNLANQTQVTGYAFGAGMDRLTMLRYGIDDLRVLFESDLDFLAAFKGA